MRTTPQPLNVHPQLGWIGKKQLQSCSFYLAPVTFLVGLAFLAGLGLEGFASVVDGRLAGGRLDGVAFRVLRSQGPVWCGVVSIMWVCNSTVDCRPDFKKL